MTDIELVRQRWAAVLPGGEESEPATGPHLDAAVAAANRWRQARDLPPLTDESHPELEFYERARTLGLRRGDVATPH